jgi:hypothetical protein
MTTLLLEALESGHAVEVQLTHGRCVPQLIAEGYEVHHAYQRGTDRQVEAGAGWVRYLVYRIKEKSDAAV